jgi:hypothetical protein
MKDIIKKVLLESGDQKPYEYHKGGYLIPVKYGSTGVVYLTNLEYEEVKPINDNMVELYNTKLKQLDLVSQHNRGVIQHILSKKLNK